MNNRNLLLQYDKDLRLHITYPEARRELTCDVMRFIRQAPGMNFVSFTLATESKLDRAIQRELEYVAPMNQPFTWKVYDHDLLPGLRSKLESHNFVDEGDPASVMVLDVANAPRESFDRGQADIHRITTRDGLKEVVEVLEAVYGGNQNWIYDRLGLHLQIPRYLSVYACYADGKPVSVAWTYFPRGHFATLFGGATVTGYRNRGLYTSLLHARLAEIRHRGYSFAVVEAGPMSKPIVAKHGFHRLTTVHEYVWQRN